MGNTEHFKVYLLSLGTLRPQWAEAREIELTRDSPYMFSWACGTLLIETFDLEMITA